MTIYFVLFEFELRCLHLLVIVDVLFDMMYLRVNFAFAVLPEKAFVTLIMESINANWIKTSRFSRKSFNILIFPKHNFHDFTLKFI